MSYLVKRNGRLYIYWRDGSGEKHGQSLNKLGIVTLVDARAYKVRFDAQRSGAILPSKKVTVAEVCREYLRDAALHLRPSTLKRHTIQRLKAFKGYTADKNITELSEVDVPVLNSFQAHLVARQISSSTVQRYMHVASALLHFAERQGWIPANPMKRVTIVKKAPTLPHYLSEDEIIQLLDTAKGTAVEVAVLLAVYTGMRASELCYADWEDFDWKARTVNVQPKPGFVPKSGKPRVIPLPKEFIARVKHLKKVSGICCSTLTGVRHDVVALGKRFRSLVTKPAGLRDCTLHTLRHTFASHLVMKGVSIYKVSKYLGHASVTTTQIYAHLEPRHEDVDCLRFGKQEGKCRVA